jgi:hypothetical protein
MYRINEKIIISIQVFLNLPRFLDRVSYLVSLGSERCDNANASMIIIADDEPPNLIEDCRNLFIVIGEYDAATLTVASRRIDRCDAMI